MSKVKGITSQPVSEPQSYGDAMALYGYSDDVKPWWEYPRVLPNAPDAVIGEYRALIAEQGGRAPSGVIYDVRPQVEALHRELVRRRDATAMLDRMWECPARDVASWTFTPRERKPGAPKKRINKEAERLAMASVAPVWWALSFAPLVPFDELVSMWFELTRMKLRHDMGEDDYEASSTFVMQERGRRFHK